MFSRPRGIVWSGTDVRSQVLPFPKPHERILFCSVGVRNLLVILGARQEEASKAMQSAGSIPALVVVARGQACALPLAHVVETMRPLPVDPVAGAPEYISGMSVVRGWATPVLDLAVLLGAAEGGDDEAAAARVVLMRDGARRFALTVGSVAGVHTLNLEGFQSLPELMRSADTQHIAGVGTEANQLMLLLAATRLIPDAIWRQLDVRER